MIIESFIYLEISVFLLKMGKIINTLLGGLTALSSAYAVSNQDVNTLDSEMYSDNRVVEGTYTLNGFRVPIRSVNLGGLEVSSSLLGHSFFTEINGLYGMYFDFNKDGQIDAISVSNSSIDARMNELNARQLYSGDTESLRVELSLKGSMPSYAYDREWIAVFAEDGTNYFADFNTGVLTTNSAELREESQKSYDDVFNMALNLLQD